MAATDPGARVVVCDAGPLIHLDELGCLQLLADFPEVLVPSSVWGEVERHRPAALAAPAVRLIRVVATPPVPADLESLGRLLPLQLGELEALQVARERKADLLLTDDTAARLAARNLGLPVHGTIGILLRSVRRGLKSASAVASLLRALPTTSTLHIKRGLLQEFIRRVEQGK